jgi:hypothetical protein
MAAQKHAEKRDTTVKKTQTEGRRSKQNVKMNERLSFLIEDALERSEVVLAAESIVEKLQGIAEDLATIEAKDLMPMFDSLTNAFGPQVAQKFNTVATEQVRQLVAALQAAKGAMDQEILRLKQGVEGGGMNDISMDAGGMTPPPEAPVGGPGEAPIGEPGLSEVPPAAGEMNAEPIPGAEGPAVGRPRKESAKPKGKKLSERKINEFESPAAPAAEAPSHSHESSYFGDNLNNLAAFHGGAHRMAMNIANMIRTGELSLDQRTALSKALSHMAAYAAEPSHWSGVNAESKLEDILQSAGIWDAKSTPVIRIVQQLKELAYLLKLHHNRMLESNIRMLRTAADPDALVLKTFRTKLAEHRDGQMAAIRTARTFAIDVEDVVSVVREAAARRPFREARVNKLSRKPVREADGTTNPAQLTEPGQLEAQADSNMGQDVPIFPVAQAGPVQAGVTPNPEGSENNQTGVGMTNGQPANQSNSTQKPMSPADMRVRQQGQQLAKQQQDATKQQVTQQVQSAKPLPQQGQQPQQPLQAQAPQPKQPAEQPQAQPKPAFKPPGQQMDQNNPALRRRASK